MNGFATDEKDGQTLRGGAKPLCSGPVRLFHGADFLYPLP
jgi:hypothetical protein